MYCEECKMKPATVHITQIHDGQKTEMHLCEECAAQKGTHVLKFDSYFSLPKLLGSIFGQEVPVMGEIAPTPRTRVQNCPKCGMSFQQIGQIGRLGCSECYTTFEQEIEPVLRRIHGNTKHAGKVPRRAGGKFELKQMIEDLKKQLQAAIKREQYEKAAELRDKIKELEKKTGEERG
ncbi:MAG TPA: hypothetical protein GXX39_02860 [Syntrophothermus lipocalidus]|nr:hypothetical protein [Syntrophothermus lipocalidus]